MRHIDTDPLASDRKYLAVLEERVAREGVMSDDMADEIKRMRSFLNGETFKGTQTGAVLFFCPWQPIPLNFVVDWTTTEGVRKDGW